MGEAGTVGGRQSPQHRCVQFSSGQSRMSFCSTRLPGFVSHCPLSPSHVVFRSRHPYTTSSLTLLEVNYVSWQLPTTSASMQRQCRNNGLWAWMICRLWPWIVYVNTVRDVRILYPIIIVAIPDKCALCVVHGAATTKYTAYYTICII